MNIKQLVDLDVKGKRVLIREDLNVPLRNGEIASAARIEAALPTIKFARDAGAHVLVMSHLGRPTEGSPERQYSLQPIADYLSNALGQPVNLISDYLQQTPVVQAGEVALLENVRFNPGEGRDCEDLGKSYAGLCDIFVMDAFGAAHRAQASTHSLGRFAGVACAGPLLVSELDALENALKNPKRPLVAIVGGAKVSTKLTVLESLLNTVDRLIPGGGIANTFIAAAGYSVGKSLYEPELIDQAEALIDVARQRNAEIPVPTDVVVGKEFSANALAQIKPVDQVAKDDMIFDIGPDTVKRYSQLISHAGTIVWNGPVGVFEFEQFSSGTRELGEAIAKSSAFSIAGGGDTLAAIDQFGLDERISYISTGGGAFLEFLEGKTLPAVAMLESRA